MDGNIEAPRRPVKGALVGGATGSLQPLPPAYNEGSSMLGKPFPSPASDPLVLSGKGPFAKGGKRHCYVHPANSSLCVKVAARADGRDCHAQQRLDLEDYALLKKRGRESVFERIPQIAGVVDTDLGAGIVMQIYRDANGRISRKLAEVVRERGLTPSLIQAIDELKEWQRKQRLLTRDTGPHNVLAVCLGNDDWKLVIIEGWLHRRNRWLALIHPLFEGYLIGRQLRKFDRRVAHCARTRHDGS